MTPLAVLFALLVLTGVAVLLGFGKDSRDFRRRSYPAGPDERH